jgi:Co/Zn/Cd efflux system component/YHS domain-containing protein
VADACCDPVLDLGATHARQRRVLGVVLGINLATFAMVAVGAYLSRSTSLLSGGLDNLGDALTYALSLAVVGSTVRAQSKVALVKGILILAAALGVAAQIVYRLLNPTVPVFETMGLIGLLNLGANAVCLVLLTPYRRGDVNMASAWECSRNDIFEGVAVLAAAGAVFVVDAGWPDLVIAAGLLLLFVRSALKVTRLAVTGLRAGRGGVHGPGPGRVQDPVCKCWVDEASAIHVLEHAGKRLVFCAAGCKAKFEHDSDGFGVGTRLPVLP